MCQISFLFYGCIIFHISILHLFVRSSVEGYFGLYFLAITTNAVMNICIHIFRQTYAWKYAFNFLQLHSLGIELLDNTVILCLKYQGKAKMFSTVTTPFNIPTSRVWGLQFLHILTNASSFKKKKIIAILVGMKW